MNQPTLFDLEAFNKTLDTPVYVYDPFWDEIETARQDSTVGGQISESESPCKSVGEQVLSDTLKSAPQHDTHWVEKYWVERSSHKYWYYRYCWMHGRKIHRCYLGSVHSHIAQQKKQAVESAIADGQSPTEIKQLLRNCQARTSPMSTL